MEHDFYRIFECGAMFMDGGDKTINFEMVKITKDIPTLGLIKDQEYEACWFNLESMTFHFIVWERAARSDGTYYPDGARSLEIKQSDLAPHCVW